MHHKITISKRLLAIAKMIDKKSVVADIGCDHAMLDVYLSNNGLVKKTIACDVAIGPLKEAKKNIMLYGASNIEVRLGNGLDAISEKDNVNTIVIAGLGSQKIIEILIRDTEKLKNVSTIIIQSNTGYDKVRCVLNKIGYYVKDEVLVKENDIIYVIIKFQTGSFKYTKKELYFGPILLKNKNKLFKELLQNEIKKNNKIINSLPCKKFIKKTSLKLKNKLLKKEIQGV